METKSRILLIDDEEVVIDSCSQILAGGPYEIASASDGTAGLRLVSEFHPTWSSWTSRCRAFQALR